MKNHDYYRNRKEWHLDQLASIACQTDFAQFSFLITRDVTTSLRIRNEWDYLYIMNHDYYRIRNNWYIDQWASIDCRTNFGQIYFSKTQNFSSKTTSFRRQKHLCTLHPWKLRCRCVPWRYLVLSFLFVPFILKSAKRMAGVYCIICSAYLSAESLN